MECLKCIIGLLKTVVDTSICIVLFSLSQTSLTHAFNLLRLGWSFTFHASITQVLDDETWYVSICIYKDFLLINIILIKVKECNFFLPFLVNGLRSEVTVDVSPRLPGRDCTLSDTAYWIVTTWVDVTGLSSIQQWVRWSTGIIPVRVKPFGYWSIK